MYSFNVLERLGKGTFGTVYLCERKHNKLKVVVKEVNIDLNVKQIQVAKNEVVILKSLTHPNIIQYYDSFLSNRIFYIVMEYAHKGSLYDFIKQQYNQYLQQQVVLNFFAQMLIGLNYIHSKSIIHRDLKSENIFLTGQKANVIKIGDFGISKLLQGDAKTNTFIGTTNYLAPEMCEGKSYDIKSDIWSLGCLLYELCALERMFEGPVANIIFSISTGKKKTINRTLYEPGVQYMIDVMLQLDPAARPTTTNLLKFPILLPNVHQLGVNLGCIFYP